MSHLQTLYRQVILEHSRRPHNRGELPGATHTEGGHNVSCGDRVQVQLRVQGGLIEDARFTAEGCAISVASASLLTGLLRGQTPTEALALVGAFSRMLQSGEADPALGEAAALRGVHDLPTRIKCAALPWQTVRVLLEAEG